ncbi:hypothetical protein H4Q26_016998 [Puccinia striiformis f. sp. tritici PST-130]|nr:hypothetical protein H4Q26_016998 [Puccinia striiformis f. sp. tritici PST-130]
MPFAVKQNSKFIGCWRIIKRLEVSSLKFSSLEGCKRYPALKERSYSVVVAFYKKAMIPKNRLVSDLVAAEATYINTGHPDFIGGHKAMPLVNAKIEAAKAAPLTGPLTLDILDPGFFGSFWKGGPQGPCRKGQGASMMDPPPQTLEAAGVLSEHEVIETDVILYRPDVLDDLMNKSKIVVNWRKECTK